MIKVITSLALTLLVSGIFGILFRDWLVFGLVTILQILFFYFFNTIYENFLIKRAIEIGAETEKVIYDNTTKVDCPCGSSQEITLSLTEDTIYRCDACKNEIRATTSIGTALVTTPLVTKS
tara:strand:- start:18854 stop:19216 length:363 start_codon:yes stop_codon:yes gene_type:complete